jgi:hypothetical protein
MVFKAYFDTFAKHIQDHGVDIILGDFSMACFKVIPELRSRGINIDLLAWYPWRDTATQELCYDSCAIFVVTKQPMLCKLAIGLDRLHDDNPKGLSADAAPGEDQGLALYADGIKGHGPGQKHSCYLPKTATVKEKLEETLTQLPWSQEAKTAVAESWDKRYADAKGTGKQGWKPRVKQVMTWKEKRLDAEVWKFEGNVRKGAHYPLCVFTANEGRRSAEAYLRRGETDGFKRPARPPPGYHSYATKGGKNPASQVTKGTKGGKPAITETNVSDSRTSTRTDWQSASRSSSSKGYDPSDHPFFRDE